MSSLITLGIGEMEVDWGKNSSASNHSNLFQQGDFKLVPHYYIGWETDEMITRLKEGLSRKIKYVKPRLELLGYDLASIRTRFNELVRDHEDHGCSVPLTFDSYFNAIKELDLLAASTVKYEVGGRGSGYDLGEYVEECVLQIPEIKQKLIGVPVEYCIEWSDVIRDLSIFLENLDPYITLRILAENPANSDLELQWNFSDEVEYGWINREDVCNGLAPINRVLIVTEGSSDSFILKKAIQDIYPHISDFFDFIDMKDNYPFTGTGSLYNFCVGLCRINVQNNIIVVFDNDTAGVEKYRQAMSLEKPSSFLVTKLPDHPDFCDMQTVGPQGNTVEDINGKAVAIECFLDFGSVEHSPCIRWTEYRKNERAYQGELENKDSYVQAFKRADLLESTYDSGKLKYLIDYLVEQWISR